MELANVINGAYLASAILFFFGFKRLSSPATARSGNAMAATRLDMLYRSLTFPMMCIPRTKMPWARARPDLMALWPWCSAVVTLPCIVYLYRE